MRTIAKRLVQLALEAAYRRVATEKKTDVTRTTGTSHRRAKEVRMDFLTSGDNRGTWNPSTMADKEVCFEIPSITMDTGGSSSLLPSKHRKSRHVQFASMEAPEPMVMQIEEDPNVVSERRDVAKRLVLRCIRAACQAIEGERRGSIDDLISSIKRMRISSPSPSLETEAPKPSLLNGDKPWSPCVLVDREKPLPEEPALTLPERCLTPESMRMQNIRKKRGRSESHEVNSLNDYDRIRTHFAGLSSRGRRGERSLLQISGNGVIGEEEAEDDNPLSSLVENLGMMMIEDDESEDIHEKEKEHSRPLTLTTNPATEHGSGNNSSPFTPTHAATPLFTRVPPTTPTIVATTPTFTIVPDGTTLAHLDARTAANIGSVPSMDVFVILHSCPPNGICQKFLCHNTNEINLVYHCWLFRDISCEPHVTVSDRVEVGVFDPCGVQPVHLDLQDGGAPFHYTDARYINNLLII